jgi:hypothetical protein
MKAFAEYRSPASTSLKVPARHSPCTLATLADTHARPLSHTGAAAADQTRSETESTFIYK